jgi:hypothetical protein
LAALERIFIPPEQIGEYQTKLIEAFARANA